jgi:hypothetical protein
MVSGKQRRLCRSLGADGGRLLIALHHSVHTGAGMASVPRGVVEGGSDVAARAAMEDA